MARIKLIENSGFIITKDNIKKIDSNKLVESIEGSFKALAVVKKVPISKYIENANGRIYPKKLWENVLKQKMAEGTLALADHPEDDGSVKDIWGVWHNMQLDENQVYADLYLVEEKPIKVLEAGGKLGTSSVGWGEFGSDEKTVIAESFDLERAGDIVMNPSQGTFATFENIKESPISTKIDENREDTQENIDKLADFSEAQNTNKRNNFKENTVEKEDKMDKFAELNFRNHVQTKISEAKEATNIKKALTELSGLEIDDSMVDIKEKVSATIVELQEKLDTKLSESEKTIQSLEEKIEGLEKEKSELSEKVEKASSLLEKAGVSDEKSISKFQEENSSLKEDFKAVKSDLNTLIEDTKKRDSDIRILVSDRKLMESDISSLLEDRDLMLSDIKKFKEEYEAKKSFEEKLIIAEKHITKLEKVLEEDYGYEFEEASKKSEEEDPQEDDADEKDTQDKKIEKTSKKSEVDDPQKDDEEDKADDGTEEKDDKKEEKKESILIRRYVAEEIKRNPALKDIKTTLIESVTLEEAVRKAIQFKEQKDIPVRMDEATMAKRPAWLGKRK